MTEGMNGRLDDSIVKQITGGDSLVVRRLYENSSESNPSYKIFLACNKLPEFDNGDPAMMRRLHVVPFDVVIPRSDQDLRLSDKLDEELPGILNWAIEGSLKWQEDELTPPKAVSDVLIRLRAQSDPVGTFIEEECAIGRKMSVTKARLHKSFDDWCFSHDLKNIIGKNSFGSAMKGEGFADGTGDHGTVRIWKGLALKTPSKRRKIELRKPPKRRRGGWKAGESDGERG